MNTQMQPQIELVKVGNDNVTIHLREGDGRIPCGVSKEGGARSFSFVNDIEEAAIYINCPECKTFVERIMENDPDRLDEVETRFELTVPNEVIRKWREWLGLDSKDTTPAGTILATLTYISNDYNDFDVDTDDIRIKQID